MKKDNKKHAGGAKQKEKKDIYQIKDFVPSNLIDQVIPQQPLKKISVNNIEPFNAEHIPNTLFPEWENKSIEELNKECEENFPDNSSLFCDEDHIKISSNLPFSLILQTKNNIEWKRPNEYVLNYYLDHQIQVSYPKKNYITTRENMIQFHNKTLRENALKATMNKNKENDIEEEDEEDDIDFFLREDEEMRKLNMYKDLLGILSKKYEYKIVNTTKTLIEIDEEAKVKEDNNNNKKSRKKKEVNKNQEQDKNPLGMNIIEEGDKRYLLTIKPSNIYLKNFINDENLHNQYYSWLSSVYQLIIDLNIPDMETNKSIFSNIYPQRDGIPYYNPKGKYILKLYQHGKPRKVIIDDRMPCNINSEYILPQCEVLEEIWPAIFFKGLTKLNMYKIRHPSYYFKEEFMDTNLIYALTGMQVITLDLNVNLLTLFKNKFIITEEKEKDKDKNEKKFFALYSKKTTKKMNLNKSKSYYDVQSEMDFRNHINGTYINNYNLQGKNIIPVQKGEKIILKARERSGSIIEKSLNLFEKSKNILNKNDKDKEKDNKDKDNKNKDKDKGKEKQNNKNSNKKIEESKENKEKEEKQKSEITKSSNKKAVFQRSPNKKQTTLMKEIQLNTGELKRKNRKTDLIDQKNNIIYNYLYAADDFFCNENFNMKRLNFLDFSDLVKELEDKKVEFKRLPADKKRQYIIERKKLKLEKLEEKKRRIQCLKETGNNYNLIHIINQTLNLPQIEYFSEYTSENVELAKKCLLNNWVFPPPSTFQKEFLKAEDQQKSLMDLKKLEDKVIPGKKKKKEVNKNKPLGMFTWTKDMYEELIGGKEALEVYKNAPKIPKKSRLNSGGWITFDDMCNKFNKLIIIQNTKLCYKESLYVDNEWHNYKTDEFHPSEDNAIFLFVKTPFDDISNDEINEGNNKVDIKNMKKQIKKKEKNKKVEEEKSESENSHLSDLRNSANPNCSILIIFEPLNEEFKLNEKISEITYPYISLDLIEKDTNISIKKNIILNKFYSEFYFPYLLKKKEYFVKINGGYTPFGYNLQLFSDFFKIQHVSVNNFLKKFFAFQEFSTTAETFGPIEKNKNYMLAKVSFNLKDTKNYDKLRFKIDIKHEFYFLKKYITVFLVKDNPYYKKEIETEKIFSFASKNNFYYKNNLTQNDEYYFVFYIKPEIDLPETEFNIRILYNQQNLVINEVNNLEPYEISDIYYKNKDSILFSYFIYPSEKIYTSFDINFIHFKPSNEENTNINNNTGKLPPNISSKNISANTIITSNEKQQINKDKCIIVPLSNDEHYHINLELYQLTKEPSLDFVENAMKFSYSNQGNLIKHWKFANNLSVANCVFIGDLLQDLKKKKSPGNKNEKVEDEDKKTFPYVLLCYIDVQKISDLNIPDDIGFIIRVYASNTLSFIKDRTKEEHEKKMKEKWEENDEGRSKLAIKSRLKFRVYAKNLRHQKLDENELKILNEERKRRTANEIDHVASMEEPEVKGNKKKGKKNEGNNKEKEKNKNLALNKNKINLLNSEDEDNMSGSNLLNKNLMNFINKKARPLSMANIFKHKKPLNKETKSTFILNFINYSSKESKDRTIYKKLDKMPLLKKDKFFRNRKIIISDEKYRQKIKTNIISLYEASENELKKNNEEYFKSTRDIFDKINVFNKDLNSQRRAQSINTESLLNRRKKLQGYIQKKLDMKKDILTGIEENQKFLENLKKNKKEINNKKGEGINYEEQLKLYKEAKALLENDPDVVKFFNVLSNVKEEELKIEYERLKSSNDKNKEALFSKMMEDIQNNNWNINKDFIEKLKKEIEDKNAN